MLRTETPEALAGYTDLADLRADIEYCLRNPEFLNEWEVRFLFNQLGFKSFSERQRDKLETICNKVDQARRICRRAAR